MLSPRQRRGPAGKEDLARLLVVLPHRGLVAVGAYGHGGVGRAIGLRRPVQRHEALPRELLEGALVGRRSAVGHVRWDVPAQHVGDSCLPALTDRVGAGTLRRASGHGEDGQGGHHGARRTAHHPWSAQKGRDSMTGEADWKSCAATHRRPTTRSFTAWVMGWVLVPVMTVTPSRLPSDAR